MLGVLTFFFFFKLLLTFGSASEWKIMLFQHEKAKPQYLENAETAHSLCLLLCFPPSNYSPVIVPNAVAQQTLPEPQCLGIQVGFVLVWLLWRSHPKEFPGEAGTGIPAWAALITHGLGGVGVSPRRTPLGHSCGGVLGSWKGASLQSYHLCF